jgi:2-desacetyl-2-hydroxyethyl bacteriochlorophyllide A dehydrogenase
MRALVYVGPEKLEIQQMSDPAPQAGEVLLKISAAGICGSDLHGFLGHGARRKPPLVLGHEAIATIVQAHPVVRGWPPGQRVCVNPLISCSACSACLAGRQNLCANWKLLSLDRLHGTYSEYLAVPATQLYAVPEGLSELDAILTEPLANVVHLFRTSLAEIPETIAVFGSGAIGILVMLLARVRGVARVCVVDRNEQRLEVARQMKADLVLNSDKADAVQEIRRWTGGEGADFSVDAVGVPPVRRAAVASLRRGGRAVFIGLAENESSLPFIEMIRDEKHVFTSFAYTPTDFAAALRLIESGRISLRDWTETLPLDRGQEAFHKMAHDPGATLKMVLKV